MIIGFTGSCRKQELAYLHLEDVKDEGHFFHFRIPNKKTRSFREFFITSGDVQGLDFVEIIRSYIRLRPENTDCNRFFIRYWNGKCTRQPVGINKFGVMTKEIASFLKLVDSEQYTSHCFRSKKGLATGYINTLF